ncbi:MAG: Sporulation kinase E [Firmicutes bacterium ADurb.Bin373]|nr:MAG: Sporulation kinase E [Firmicutes bacterium ADurb.Bin373]
MVASDVKKADPGPLKQGRRLRFKGSYKDRICSLKEEWETRRLCLEAECQALRETLVELEESRNRYAVLYDCAPVGYATLDKQGRIKDINLAGSAMLGIEPFKLIDMPLSAFVVKDDIRLLLEHLRLCSQSNQKVSTELSLASKNGRPVQVQLLSVPDRCPDGGALCFRTIFTDVTESKLYKKEMARLDRLHLVGEMAAGIAHEIRNPMTVVRGFLQFFGEKSDLSKYKGYLDLMIEELDRANSIISEFLSLARNKAVELKESDLNTLIKNIFPLLQADGLVADKFVELDLQDVPKLKLDEKEIRQLIHNLARNGMDAMPSNGTLKIRTYLESEEVILAVEDQGGGIPPEIAENIGTPFFTTKDTGTGLGLAVCYSIAKRHEARIDFETGPGGTTFFVRFKVSGVSGGRGC